MPPPWQRPWLSWGGAADVAATVRCASCTDGKHVAVLCLKQTVALVLNATEYLSTVWAAMLFVQTHLVVWHLSVRKLSRDYFSSNNVTLDNSPISQREKQTSSRGAEEPDARMAGLQLEGRKKRKRRRRNDCCCCDHSRTFIHWLTKYYVSASFMPGTCWY